MPAVSATGTPRLSIVIASYNARATIARCLGSLADQVRPGEAEVIVVDSSTDGTAELVGAHFPWVRLVRSAARLYPGDARNLGIARARGELLAFTDTDCVVAPGWVAAILAAHRAPDLAIGGVVANGNPESPVGWAAYFCEFSQWMPGTRPGPMVEIPTCCLAIKRRAFERYGPFIGGTYCSDTVFHWRLGRDGHRPRFDPALRIGHLNIGSLGRLLRKGRMHGRAFATVRIAEQRFSTGRRVAYGMLAPALPALLFARMARRVFAARHYRARFVLAAPLVLLGLAAWSWGEGEGYWSRARPAGAAAPRVAATGRAAGSDD